VARRHPHLNAGTVPPAAGAPTARIGVHPSVQFAVNRDQVHAGREYGLHRRIGSDCFQHANGSLNDGRSRIRSASGKGLAPSACISDTLVFPGFEGHLSALGGSRRKLVKKVQRAEVEAAIPRRRCA
jgi:hypothetical protein